MTAETRPASSGHSNYVLFLLMLAFMFSFIDRTLMSLLIDPIRGSFGLSEIQISLLVGFSFALFYTVMGIPCGILADRWSRKTLVAIGIVVWSVATVFCGLASGFWFLFFARMMVGVGEASLGPAAYSLIPDLFPPDRVGRATSLFIAGGSVAAGLALVLGGNLLDWTSHITLTLPWFGEIGGWKLAFVIVGAPGILLGLLFQFTVQEPPRIAPKSASRSLADAEVVQFIRANGRVLLLLALGTSAVVGSNYSWIIWGPSFFIRVHEFTLPQAGLLFGILLGFVGIASVLIGGAISDRFMKRGHVDGPLRVYLIAVAVSLPCLIVGFLSTNLWVSLVLVTVGVSIVLLQGGMIGVLIIQLCPAGTRGQMTAIYGIVSVMIGVGFAPTGTAWLTEYIFGGTTGVGKSVAVSILVFGVIALLTIWRAMPAARELVTRNLAERAAA